MTIFFDLDDTIYDRFMPFSRAFELFFEGKMFDRAYDVFKACNLRSIKALADMQSGEITWNGMLVNRYKKGFADNGISISDEQAFHFNALYTDEQTRLKMTDTMSAILDCCKSKFEKTGIITNGNAKHQREKITRLGLDRWITPELIIISDEHKVLKPAYEIFRRAGLAAGASPKEMIMVGDSYQTDICGAVGFGMKAIWMNRHNESSTPGKIIPDHVVHNEEELLALICCRSFVPAEKNEDNYRKV